MKVHETPLNGPILLEPDVFGDGRGYFMEIYREERYRSMGVDASFVQDNLSRSTRAVLRGLHYQLPHPQAKLISVLQGEIFDVAVDVRQGSPTYGSWYGVHLSDENHRQLYLPTGLAHGFCTLSETAIVQYKCSDYYHPECEHTIRWNDEGIGVDWPVEGPIVSEKDANGLELAAISPVNLPTL